MKRPKVRKTPYFDKIRNEPLWYRHDLEIANPCPCY
ncbi:hypothetical protein VPHD249_0210 [Vibrio phage D249]